jgi:hypothetical protein
MAGQEEMNTAVNAIWEKIEMTMKKRWGPR